MKSDLIKRTLCPFFGLRYPKKGFARLNTETSRTVLNFYKSRKNASAADSDQRYLPQLHTHWEI
jgi:hypothetical protein